MGSKLQISIRNKPHQTIGVRVPETSPSGGDCCASFYSAFQGLPERGFTLLEMMMVLTLILILASFAFPSYRTVVVRGREAVLSNDLFTMRKVIDQFTVDKHHPPTSLNDLVEAGYLRGGIPRDPFTNSDKTWVVDSTNVPMGSDVTTSGIVDVHSGSKQVSLNGTPYSTW